MVEFVNVDEAAQFLVENGLSKHDEQTTRQEIFKWVHKTSAEFYIVHVIGLLHPNLEVSDRQRWFTEHIAGPAQGHQSSDVVFINKEFLPYLGSHTVSCDQNREKLFAASKKLSVRALAREKGFNPDEVIEWVSQAQPPESIAPSGWINILKQCRRDLGGSYIDADGKTDYLVSPLIAQIMDLDGMALATLKSRRAAKAGFKSEDVTNAGNNMVEQCEYPALTPEQMHDIFEQEYASGKAVQPKVRVTKGFDTPMPSNSHAAKAIESKASGSEMKL